MEEAVEKFRAAQQGLKRSRKARKAAEQALQRALQARRPAAAAAAPAATRGAPVAAGDAPAAAAGGDTRAAPAPGLAQAPVAQQPAMQPPGSTPGTRHKRGRDEHAGGSLEPPGKRPARSTGGRGSRGGAGGAAAPLVPDSAAGGGSGSGSEAAPSQQEQRGTSGAPAVQVCAALRCAALRSVCIPVLTCSFLGQKDAGSVHRSVPGLPFPLIWSLPDSACHWARQN